MLDGYESAPRRDPLRSGRIFMLASVSTLGEIHQAKDDEARAKRVGRLLLSALECLTTVRSERALGVKACAHFRAQCDEEYLVHPQLGSIDNPRGLSVATEGPGLTYAIETLTDMLSSLLGGNCQHLAGFVPTLNGIVQQLSTEESN